MLIHPARPEICCAELHLFDDQERADEIDHDGRAAPARSVNGQAGYYEIDRPLCQALEHTRQRGGRVVAVGTSSVRALESAAAETGSPRPTKSWTDLFIVPGYKFRVVDSLLTNFHLPKSSLLCLVSAFAGREHVFEAYRVAASTGYRFYSYGDAMLIHSAAGMDR